MKRVDRRAYGVLTFRMKDGFTASVGLPSVSRSARVASCEVDFYFVSRSARVTDQGAFTFGQALRLCRDAMPRIVRAQSRVKSGYTRAY